jgi:hypothetical protein
MKERKGIKQLHDRNGLDKTMGKTKTSTDLTISKGIKRLNITIQKK